MTRTTRFGLQIPDFRCPDAAEGAVPATGPLGPDRIEGLGEVPLRA